MDVYVLNSESECSWDSLPIGVFDSLDTCINSIATIEGVAKEVIRFTEIDSEIIEVDLYFKDFWDEEYWYVIKKYELNKGGFQNEN